LDALADPCRDLTTNDSEASRLERIAMKVEREEQAKERLAAHEERVAQRRAREDTTARERQRRLTESSLTHHEVEVDGF